MTTELVRNTEQQFVRESSDLFPFRKKEESILGLMRDEFSAEAVNVPPLLRRVIVQMQDRSAGPDARGRYPLAERDISSALVRELEYLSITGDLEWDSKENPSERARLIQTEVLDKLTAGTKVRTRVVIANRDDGPNAFVFPDGTTVVTQSLINRLSNFDELAGVLGHEVGHLIDRTSFNIRRATEGHRFGVAWLHEAACDAKAPELLEKAGFNSMAFATAIEKVAGSQRGFAHQSGLARASQSIGQHWAIDRRTSSSEVKPMPDILRTERIETNKVIFEEILYRNSRVEGNRVRIKNVTEIEAGLQYLHPRDLAASYFGSLLTRDVCENLIQRRLTTSGYTKAEIDLFLASVTRFRIDEVVKPFPFSAPDEVVEIARALPAFERENKEAEIYDRIFGETLPEKDVQESQEKRFLDFVNYNLYDIHASKQPKSGIPVTQQSIVEILAVLQEGTLGQPTQQIVAVRTALLMSYIGKVHIANAQDFIQQVDQDQIRDLFEQCKERNVSLHQPTIEQYWGNEIDEGDQDALNNAYYEVFGQIKFGLESIDGFFERFKRGEVPSAKELEEFTESLKAYFRDHELDDSQRFIHLSQISKKISEARFMVDTRVEDFLRTGRVPKRYREDLADTSRYASFNMKLYMGLSLFEQDGPEFYQYLQNTMNESGIDADKLTQIELLNLCQGMFSLDYARLKSPMYIYGASSFDEVEMFKNRSVQIKDYKTLLDLPFVRKIIEKGETPNAQTWRELNDYISSFIGRVIKPKEGRTFLFGGDIKDPTTLFDEDLRTSIVGRGIRENVAKLLEQEVEEADLVEIGRFIDEHYPPGIKRAEFTKEIHKRLLSSGEIPFEQRVQYLVKNFDSIGAEGASILADTIEDIETYRQFREKVSGRVEGYLEGSSLVTAIAVADVVTGIIAREGSSPGRSASEEIIKTTIDTPKAKKATSTTFAQAWFKSLYSGILERNDRVQYDRGNEQFVLNERSREVFKTVADIFANTRELSPTQRLALAHKLLTEEEGALSDWFKQKRLGKKTAESLRLRNGFVKTLLSEAPAHADPKLLSFPAASMLGPMLFRSFDVDAVDISRLRKTKVYYNHGDLYHEDKDPYEKLKTFYSDDELRRILTSDTRSIVRFGAKYRANSDSLAAELTQESDEQYHRITDRLETILGAGEKDVDENGKVELDPAFDTIIRGAEMSGPLGVRALQLTTQFYRFSPNIERRLSETFDRNPGLNKLLFWENLHKLAKEDNEVSDFLTNVRLGDYLGGGSLQTTYAAVHTGEDRVEKPIVVKMQNPNVEAFIREGHDSAQRTLRAVLRQSIGKRKEYAQAGMALMDLAREWCLDDVSDQTFIEDDDRFAITVERFNQDRGDLRFDLPNRVLTHGQVKSEELVPGSTLNQFLKDESVDASEKRKVVEAVSEFFLTQLREPVGSDEAGVAEYLIHSDPHVGNYVVNESQNETRIGVIDRSFYLKLKEEDVRVLEKLVSGENDTEFVNLFIDRVLDANEAEGANRAKVRRGVFSRLRREAVFQKIRGGTDRLTLMRLMMSELADRNMRVPLKLRLMIRNIGAFQELAKRYGIDLEELYRKS